MDLLQITLIIVLIILTINLFIVGIYIALILKEFRETVRKANVVMDNVADVSTAVATPITSISGIIGGVSESISAVKSISSLFDKREDN